jgi:2-(1,2-epoxy-1,2-dihydrophenyl)acetyl-CoA isomerase
MATTPQAGTAPLVLELREGAVVTLVLNRPERLNALNPALTGALVEALERVKQDAGVRCAVLTGAGRAFCAGGDITMMRDARERRAGAELETMLRNGVQITLLLREIPKPVVAMVNGPAAGAGMNIALACDMRIASDQASFGQNFAKVGLFPDFGGTFLLPRLVGPAVAAEMLYTGDMITAAEAARLGIVNQVVPQEKLEQETRAWVERLLAAPPLAAAGIKQALFGTERAELERALEFEVKKQVECFLSEDGAEGLSAFFEKRKPHFQGR